MSVPLLSSVVLSVGFLEDLLSLLAGGFLGRRCGWNGLGFGLDGHESGRDLVEGLQRRSRRLRVFQHGFIA
jgi:hypothetical protein